MVKVKTDNATNGLRYQWKMQKSLLRRGQHRPSSWSSSSSPRLSSVSWHTCSFFSAGKWVIVYIDKFKVSATHSVVNFFKCSQWLPPPPLSSAYLTTTTSWCYLTVPPPGESKKRLPLSMPTSRTDKTAIVCGDQDQTGILYFVVVLKKTVAGEVKLEAKREKVSASSV